MSAQTSTSVATGGAGGTLPAPALRGSRCTSCGNVAFPVAVGCQRCGSHEVAPLDLACHGTVWAHTVQHFAPKSPPYVPPAEGFVPFAVGYVELPDGVKVEAVLECSDHAELAGADVTLIATEPVPRFATGSWLDEHRDTAGAERSQQ